MESLVKDPRYFAQVNLTNTSTAVPDWSGDLSHENVAAVIACVLGSDFVLAPQDNEDDIVQCTGLAIFDILSELLPKRSSQTSFFWERFCRPYASLLETSHYSFEVQCKFLIFLWARVIGFLGPEEGPEQPTFLTQDGSTCEASWVIPNHTNVGPGEATRSLRFALHPIDPRSGKFLRGTAVMDYITSEAGSLGIVYCPETALDWRTAVDNFLYGHLESSDDIAIQSSGFFMGFGLLSSGHIALKSYFQPPFPSPNAPPSIVNCPMHVTDSDFRPLRTLLTELHPTLLAPFELLIEYLDSVQPPKRPIFHMMAVDVVPNEKNRIKIYVQTRTGMGISWLDVERNFTMGGRLTGPEIKHSLAILEKLWNHLFPSTDSTSGLDLIEQTMIEHGHLDDSEEHPPGGIGYYYELAPGSMTVAPKVYLPVRHWCKNDKFVCDAVEAFYAEKAVGVELPSGSDQSPGWVSREMSSAFDHRPLGAKNGIATWVTFGHKKKGWELTSYYSPEIWLQ